jgi:hypothetical protein
VNSELEVLFDVVARLEGAGIDDMLTGSVAMSLRWRITARVYGAEFANRVFPVPT